MTEAARPSWPPGPPPGVGPGAQDQTPGTLGYWIGGAMFGIGLILLAAIVNVGIHQTARYFAPPTDIGRVGNAKVDEPGRFVIFVIGDGSEAAPSSRPTTFQVVDPTGSRVHADDYVGDRNGFWTFTGRRAVATFHAERAGEYRISGSPLESGESLGVAKEAPMEVAPLMLGFAGAGILFSAGIVVLVVTAVRRRPPSQPDAGCADHQRSAGSARSVARHERMGP